jgi:hypothetical protein
MVQGEQQRMAFTSACLKYFGKKEGQSNTDFMQEVRALSEKDRADLTALFPTVGITII